MTNAVNLIKAYAQRRLSIDQLKDGLADLVAEGPDGRARVIATLERARKAGLPEKVHRTLLEHVRAQRAPVPEPEASVHIETVVLPTSPLLTGAQPSDAAETTEPPRAEGEPKAPEPGAGVAASPGIPNDDATEVAPGAGDRTTVDPDAAARAIAAAIDDTFGSTPTGPESEGSWPLGTSGPDEPEFTSGTLLRRRFRLLSPLGEGGMGMVWKAVDLLKEEARDRNPYVAIKLLQGDFKEHPEAFIALQRETAKQQRLAHPNIATVFDFDRDTDTGTVFMTMEVLDGDDLAAFIRRLPEGGLPFDEAMELIGQLAEGLGYAHENQLVHSDLKPGNCFITRERTVKLLDFGIARASKTRTDAEGETTLFDPAALGALTPTYATIEMFEGLDPDPRDDIYALAIIAHQLLTGKHPYDRKSAPKAKELGLKPAPVAKLDKRQNRALAAGLALARDARTPSVEAFVDGMRKHKSYAKQIAVGALAASLFVGWALFDPVVGFFEKRENEAVIAELAAGDADSMRAGLERLRQLETPAQRDAIRRDPRVIQAIVGLIAGSEAGLDTGLELIAPFPPGWQQDIRNAEPARRAIFARYARQRDAAVLPAEGRFDYPVAERALDTLSALYADSAEVLRLRQELQRGRDSELSRLDERFNDLLGRGLLIEVEGEEDISDVLAVIGQIDPAHPLLADPRLPLRFEELVRESMSADGAEGYEQADRLLQASIAYAPEDPALGNLRFEVGQELQRRRDQALIVEIEARLTALAPRLRELDDFAAARADIAKLAELAPESALLGTIQSRLGLALNRTLDRQVASGARNEAEDSLLAFAPLLEIPYLVERRAALDASTTASPRPGRPEIAERIAAIGGLLAAEQRLTAQWEQSLRVPLNELVALVPANAPALLELRQGLAEAYLVEARAAREKNGFAQAREILARGERLHPGYDDFARERAAIADAAEALRARQEEARRLARIEGQKRTLLAKAAANQAKEAADILGELRSELPANDAFLAAEAPDAVAGAYSRLAAQAADGRQWPAAVQLAEAGLAHSPGVQPLVEALEGYRTELAKEREIIALGESVSGPGPHELRALRARLESVRAEFPERYPRIVADLGAAMATALAKRTPTSPGELAGVADSLRVLGALFPDHLEPARRALGQRIAAAVTTREAQDPAGAHSLLEAARAALPDDRQLAALVVKLPAKPSPLAEKGIASVGAGDLSEAERILGQVRRQTPDAANLTALERQLADRRGKALEDYENYQRYVAARREQEGRPYLLRAMTWWRDNPDPAWKVPETRTRATRGTCAPELAGLGKGRGVCYDKIGEARGPVLVVVPGEGSRGPFAIGKYEVSIGEFNQFCAESGRCPARPGDERIPVTGISLADAEAYAGWLSQKSEATYRLPSEAEWEFAANAGGQQPRKNFNCTVKLGAKVIKGQDLVNVRSGDANGWGLTNYVGNAQEWVKIGVGVSARGGAHSDPLSKCDVTFTRSHPGNPDDVTGFRLVRELG